jgi:DNA-binding NarL/FixJ family response regulator
VVALDIGMPNLNGLEAAREILNENPKTKILFLTIYDTEQAVKTALQVGAKGLILKSDAARELVTAVEAIQRNMTYFSSQTSQAVLRPDLRGYRRSAEKETLTRREKQVVQLLAEGRSTKEVASLLDLSVKTAETHRSNIMSKLGLHSSANWSCTQCGTTLSRPLLLQRWTTLHPRNVQKDLRYRPIPPWYRFPAS